MVIRDFSLKQQANVVAVVVVVCVCAVCLSVFFVLIDSYLGKMKGKESVNRTHPQGKENNSLILHQLKGA